jgi:hypothetical protein
MRIETRIEADNLATVEVEGTEARVHITHPAPGSNRS